LKLTATCTGALAGNAGGTVNIGMAAKEVQRAKMTANVALQVTYLNSVVMPDDEDSSESSDNEDERDGSSGAEGSDG
jgi:hypothetical protein